MTGQDVQRQVPMPFHVRHTRASSWLWLMSSMAHVMLQLRLLDTTVDVLTPHRIGYSYC